MQRLVGDEMRATTVAVVTLLCNLVGMGIGSQLVRILSDLLRPGMGSESIAIRDANHVLPGVVGGLSFLAVRTVS